MIIMTTINNNTKTFRLSRAIHDRLSLSTRQWRESFDIMEAESQYLRCVYIPGDFPHLIRWGLYQSHTYDDVVILNVDEDRLGITDDVFVSAFSNAVLRGSMEQAVSLLIDAIDTGVICYGAEDECRQVAASSIYFWEGKFSEPETVYAHVLVDLVNAIAFYEVDLPIGTLCLNIAGHVAVTHSGREDN